MTSMISPPVSVGFLTILRGYNVFPKRPLLMRAPDLIP
jgi:hypothetical protein